MNAGISPQHHGTPRCATRRSALPVSNGKTGGRIAAAILLLLAFGCIGCHTLLDEVDDCTINLRNWCLADHSWYSNRWCYDVCHKKDFGCGYRAGYVNVASGGNGCPPPLPPRQYWCICHQGECGQDRTRSWYDGWAEGVRVASDQQVNELNRVFIPASRLPSQVGIPERGDIDQAAALAPPLDEPAELGPPPAPADDDPPPALKPNAPAMEGAEESEPADEAAESKDAPVETRDAAPTSAVETGNPAVSAAVKRPALDVTPKPPLLPLDDVADSPMSESEREETEESAPRVLPASVNGGGVSKTAEATVRESSTSVKVTTPDARMEPRGAQRFDPYAAPRHSEADGLPPEPPSLPPTRSGQPVRKIEKNEPKVEQKIEQTSAVSEAYRLAGSAPEEKPGLSLRLPFARSWRNPMAAEGSQAPGSRQRVTRLRDIVHAPGGTSE